MRQHTVLLACLCSTIAIVSAVPLPASNQELDVLQIPLSNGKELDVLTLGTAEELAERNKRTVGLLRDLFPDITKQIDDQANRIISKLLRVLGPTVLRTAIQGNSANRARSDFDADFDDDDDSSSSSGGDSSGTKVSIELPTFSPEDSNEDTDTDGSSTTTASTTIASAAANDDNVSSTSLWNNVTLSAIESSTLPAALLTPSQPSGVNDTQIISIIENINRILNSTNYFITSRNNTVTPSIINNNNNSAPLFPNTTNNSYNIYTTDNQA